MDGVLLIDKPAGPTSHDVVARIRRSTGERRIGHTGTLDPRATGLLPLVLGRATRLASWLTGGDKTYEATITLGVATETDDTAGDPIGAPAATLPDDAAVRAALGTMVGTFAQLPPRHSAKKIAGQRAYALARRDRPVELAPVDVTVRALDWIGRAGPDVHVRVTATAGFYVRALARDLGAALGCGAHLGALRRTRSGAFALEHAIGLDEAERLGPDVAIRLIPPADALPDSPSVTLTGLGLTRATHGNTLGPGHVEGRWVPSLANGQAPTRVLAPDGRLVALAVPRGGLLQPVVVLE